MDNKSVGAILADAVERYLKTQSSQMHEGDFININVFDVEMHFDSKGHLVKILKIIEHPKPPTERQLIWERKYD